MIRTVIMWTCIFILSLVGQSTIAGVIALGSIMPDVLLIALFYCSLHNGIIAGTLIGFFLGLVQDVYSPSLLGQHALATTAAGFFVGIFNVKVMRTDLVVRAVILVLAICIHDLLFSGVFLAKGTTTLAAVFVRLLTTTLPRAAYSLAFVLLIQGWNYYVKPSLRR